VKKATPVEAKMCNAMGKREREKLAKKAITDRDGVVILYGLMENLGRRLRIHPGDLMLALYQDGLMPPETLEAYEKHAGGVADVSPTKPRDLRNV
jgi:hypothetical protein